MTDARAHCLGASFGRPELSWAARSAQGALGFRNQGPGFGVQGLGFSGSGFPV